jgi:hypothetical protein
MTLMGTTSTVTTNQSTLSPASQSFGASLGLSVHGRGNQLLSEIHRKVSQRVGLGGGGMH